MKKIFLLLLLFIPVFSFHAHAQLPPTDPSWELKFSDEFDSIYPTTIDTSKWSTSFPWGQNGTPEVCGGHTLIGVNYFEQWNSTGLANHSLVVDSVGNGSLKITAYKQNNYAPITNYHPCGSPLCTDTTCYINGPDTFCVSYDSTLFNYTTAMLYSKYKYKYGYFELKFKIPQPPTPPATDSGYTIDWWLWAGDGNHHSNEIDMYEIEGKNNLYTNNVHFHGPPVDTLDQAGITGRFGFLDSSWHISALEWAPDKIDFYLDGNKIHSYPFKPDSMIPMPMIIDLDANATNFCDGVDTAHTVFPFQIQVDYIRVYQLKIECDTARSVCVYTPATYDSIYQSLTFGGGTCTPTIPTFSNTTFRATDFIELDQGFYADSTSEMLLDIVPCQSNQHYGLRSLPPLNIPQPSPKEFSWRKFDNH